jgi:uncharacterized protein YjbI with pentapeptide repeats
LASSPEPSGSGEASVTQTSSRDGDIHGISRNARKASVTCGHLNSQVHIDCSENADESELRALAHVTRRLYRSRRPPEELQPFHICDSRTVSWITLSLAHGATASAGLCPRVASAGDLAYNCAMHDTDASRPDWPTCSHHSRESGRSCVGRRAGEFDHCLAHLTPDQLDQVLQRLQPGDELDASGTPISAELLTKILHAVQGEDGLPAFGSVEFRGANFTEVADFNGVRFAGEACFDDVQFNQDVGFCRAQFTGDASFMGTRFEGIAKFGAVCFSGEVAFFRAKFMSSAGFEGTQFTGKTTWFDSARFTGETSFSGAQFMGEASFMGSRFEAYYVSFVKVRFEGKAFFMGAYLTQANFAETEFESDALFDEAELPGQVKFTGARLAGVASFDGTQFGSASFDRAHFAAAERFGPLAANWLALDRAVFSRQVLVEACAAVMTCSHARFERGVTLRLRYAVAGLTGSVLAAPSSVVAVDQPFESTTPAVRYSARQLWTDPYGDFGDADDVIADAARRFREQRTSAETDQMLWVPVLASLAGVDVAGLVVVDVDMGHCRFAGAYHLDQLQLEGRCRFSYPPGNSRLAWAPSKWTRRQVLAEERSWRGWPTEGSEAEDAMWSEQPVTAERLAVLYRALRKALEDVKNEPGAADFYYGEMEMRRHADTTMRPERAILWLYWLVSGYGLRALRSLAVLGLLGVIVTTVLVGWGLAATAPSEQMVGVVTTTPHQPARIDATLYTSTPTSAPGLPPATQRWTAQRTRIALQVATESIVFRSTSEPLTTTGAWSTIVARILGPILLALAVLSIRNRVKR